MACTLNDINKIKFDEIMRVDTEVSIFVTPVLSNSCLKITYLKKTLYGKVILFLHQLLFCLQLTNAIAKICVSS